MKKNIFLGFLLLTFFLNLSCNGDDTITPPRYESKGAYDSGTLVLFKGSLSNSSISYLSFDFNNNANNAYTSVNETNLGALSQSMFLNEDIAYVVVSGSNKIEIVNRYSLLKQGSINEGLSNPRYATVANGKLYVTNQATSTDLNDDYVAVYNLSTNVFIKNISISGGTADKIVSYNNKVYVAQGGTFGKGNKIIVLDATTDTVSNSIAIGESPNSLQIENDTLWVLCGGNSNYSPAPLLEEQKSAKLVKINLTTNGFPSTLIDFPYATTSDSPIAIYPDNLQVYDGKLYFTFANGVYEITVSENGDYSYEGLFQTAATNLLGFGIKANNIYVGDAKDNIQNGIVYVYSLGFSNESGSVGTLQKTVNIGGIAPNGFYFNL